MKKLLWILTFILVSTALYAQTLSLAPNRWDVQGCCDPPGYVYWNWPRFAFQGNTPQESGVAFNWRDDYDPTKGLGKIISQFQKKGGDTQQFILSGKTSLRISFRVYGDGVFTGVETGCGRGPMAVPYIEVTSLDPNDPAARWWAGSGQQMVFSGQAVDWIVPLDPTLWTNVSGQRASENLPWWNTAMSKKASVGLTFGQGCAYGHQLYLTSGHSTFVLRAFEVN